MIQKWLIISGIILVLIGIFFPLIKRLGVGHLPGDILIKKGSFSLYVPFTTCILISVIITLIIFLFSK